MLFLSIIIPAYNEAERLPETLALVRDYLEQQSFTAEVLVVDDGSTDGTAACVQKMQKRFPQLRLERTPENQGKGGAVRHGMLQATGEYRLFMDADHSTPITELDKFLPELEHFDVLIGSRYLHSESIKVKQPWKRRVISRSGNWLIQRALLPGIVDTQCGFKLFSAKAAEAIFSRQTMLRWSFDIELLTIAQEMGFSIKEIPVDWYDAKDSKLRAVHAALRSVKDVQTIRKHVRKKMYRKANS